jgi:hypothetical protein
MDTDADRSAMTLALPRPVVAAAMIAAVLAAFPSHAFAQG